MRLHLQERAGRSTSQRQEVDGGAGRGRGGEVMCHGGSVSVWENERIPERAAMTRAHVVTLQCHWRLATMATCVTCVLPWQESPSAQKLSASFSTRLPCLRREPWLPICGLWGAPVGTLEPALPYRKSAPFPPRWGRGPIGTACRERECHLLSPVQVLKRQGYDAACDIWSLGILLYTMLAG